MSNKLDLDYRPQSYFWADEIGVLLTSQIKGAQRKALYERFVRDGSEEDIDELLSKPKLSDQERDFIGKIHPSLMGGEYLPESLAGEVEIARITINSTTQDVTSVFASPRENEIYYRVVDEYDGETLTEMSEIITQMPMTLKEMTDFFLNAWPLLDVLESNFFEANAYDPEDVKSFVLDASSSFYAQFGQLVDLIIDEWIEKNVKNFG
jgi:hypothetical protein